MAASGAPTAAPAPPAASSSSKDNAPGDRTKIYVAVDIEKAGSNLIRDPVVAVGLVIGDAHGNVMRKQRFNLRVTWPYIAEDGRVARYNDFEPRCWDEFWAKQPRELIDLVKLRAVEQEAGWRQICMWIDCLEVAFPATTHKIAFLSDNPSYDIATIDYHLEKHCNQRAPMRYSTDGKYRSVKAADDMFDMLPLRQKQLAQDAISKVVTHDHDPVNDATFVYLTYIHAIREQARL